MTTYINRRNVTIALFIATFLAAIEGTIVSAAMPQIAKELSGMQSYSWVISAYLLMTAISTPIYGKLADLFGRRAIFTAGALIFLAGSMLSGLSQSMEQLIVFRAIQGLGAGSLITIPYTIIGDIYAYKQRAKVQGWTSSIWGIAGIIGPAIGGLLVDYVSWRWIFYMNLPFGAVSLLLLWFSLRETFEKKTKHIDYAGIAAFTTGMLSFLYSFILMKDQGIAAWHSGAVPILLLASLAALVAFIQIERRSPEPILPLKLFAIRSISVANLSCFFLSMISVVTTFYFPLWIQGVYGESATYSGIAMIPMAIMWPVGAICAGHLLSKFSVRRIASAGIGLELAACIVLVFITAQSSHLFLPLLSGLFGFGFGLAFTSFTVLVQSSVDWSIRGSAMATNSFTRSLGQTMGLSVLGLLVNTGTAAAFQADLLAESLHHVFVILVFLAGAALTVVMWLPERFRESGEQPSSQGEAAPHM